MNTTLIKRSGKVAFYGVVEEGSVTYYRMTHFTDMSVSKNSEQYSRRYVDEDFERSDITGYSPAISYSFDRCVGDPVHDDIVEISDSELTADDAVRSIILVDTFKEEKNAVMRDFSVAPESEGDSMDAYTYSGEMKVRGDKVFGTATTSDGWQTIQFTEA